VLLSVFLLAVTFRYLRDGISYTDLLATRSRLLYLAVTLGHNYFEFGFVRRGLAGSIAYHLLGPDLVRATLLFHHLTGLLVAAPAAWLVTRLPWGPRRAALFAVFLPLFVWFWTIDMGRTDMLVEALLALATVAFLRQKPAIASLAVGLALSVHENGFIFGVPLLIALLFDQGRYRRMSRAAIARGATIVCLAVLVYACLPYLPRAGTETIVETLQSKFVRAVEVDWAIYFLVSGQRGVLTSICQNLTDPNYALHVASGVFLVLLFVGALSERGHRWVLLASIPPFIFLCAVSNDLARWMGMAGFNVWLVCVARHDPSTSHERDLAWWRMGVALLIVPLIHPRWYSVEAPLFTPSPFIHHIATSRFGAPKTPTFPEALQRCDPDWHQALEPRTRDRGATAARP
jgi:hypothetical protein